MSFKVGDKVCLSARFEGGYAYLVGKVVALSVDGEWCAEFKSPDGSTYTMHESAANFFGITVEKVEPPLPEEPRDGSVLCFGHSVAWRNGDGWEVTESIQKRSWSDLLEDFGTDFTILEDRNKTIREVLKTLKGRAEHLQMGSFVDYSELEKLAEEFGVSLDD